MIFKHLFLQYNTSFGPCFGSRFMKLCGELVLGTPDQKGLGHLRKDLKDTYYYIKEDRLLPKEGGLQAWQTQSILVSQYRELEAPQVARATYLILLPLIFICVALAAPFNGLLDSARADGTAGMAGEALGDATDGLKGMSDFKAGSMTVEKCQTLIAKANTGEVSVDEIPDVRAIDAECRRLLN